MSQSSRIIGNYNDDDNKVDMNIDTKTFLQQAIVIIEFRPLTCSWKIRINICVKFHLSKAT